MMNSEEIFVLAGLVNLNGTNTAVNLARPILQQWAAETGGAFSVVVGTLGSTLEVAIPGITCTIQSPGDGALRICVEQIHNCFQQLTPEQTVFVWDALALTIWKSA